MANALEKQNIFSHQYFGLSVGIACAMLILFHVKQELSYDKGLPKANRILIAIAIA